MTEGREDALQLQDVFGRVEDDFNAALDKSLSPRGPELLYEVVQGLSLPGDSLAVDVGSGEGGHTIELASRFGIDVIGVEPLQRYIEIAERAAASAVHSEPRLEGRIRFLRGTAEEVPLQGSSVALVWCRDVLSLVADLPKAFEDMRRVLKPSGYAVIYSMFSTDRLEPREADFLLAAMACVPESMRPESMESAIRGAGLWIKEVHVLGTEWGEFAEEQRGRGATKLIRAARLLREPQRYIAQFGQDNYNIALGDNLWHVYRLIGKLSDRIYVLSKPVGDGQG